MAFQPTHEFKGIELERIVGFADHVTYVGGFPLYKDGEGNYYAPRPSEVTDLPEPVPFPEVGDVYRITFSDRAENRLVVKGDRDPERLRMIGLDGTEFCRFNREEWADGLHSFYTKVLGSDGEVPDEETG
jgi:hypothetical protein